MAYSGTYLADVGGMLLEHTAGVVMRSALLQDNPFLGMVAKDTSLGGKYFTRPLTIEAGAGDSEDFASAQAAQTSPIVVEFQVTTGKDYGIATTQYDLEESTDGDDAFEEALTLQAETKMQAVTNILARKLWRAGTGSLANTVIALTTGLNGIVQLANPSDAQFFGKGMSIQLTATDGGVLFATDIAYVLSADWIAGTVTFSTTQGGNPGLPTSWTTAGSTVGYFVRSGARAAGAKQVIGVPGWICPSSSRPVAGESFYGQDRTVNGVLCAGVYIKGGNKPNEDALIDGAITTRRFGGRPKYGFINPDSFAALEKTLQSRMHLANFVGEAGVGFKGATILAGGYEINLIPERNQVAKRCHLLELEGIKLKSIGKAPKVRNYKGQVILVRPDSDAVEARIVSQCALDFELPSHHACIDLSQ